MQLNFVIACIPYWVGLIVGEDKDIINHYAKINIYMKAAVPRQKNGNFLSLFTPILQDKICPKNSGKSDYVHFQSDYNVSICLTAMGFQNNYKHENLALFLGLESFWDKCFLFNIFFAQKI